MHRKLPTMVPEGYLDYPHEREKCPKCGSKNLKVYGFVEALSGARRVDAHCKICDFSWNLEITKMDSELFCGPLDGSDEVAALKQKIERLEEELRYYRAIAIRLQSECNVHNSGDFRDFHSI